MRGADADTDHLLVKTKIRVRIFTQPNIEKKTNINWNTEKLKTEQTQEIYQKVITEKIEDTQQGYNVNEH